MIAPGGFAIYFPDTPPSFDIAELEKKVLDIIDQELPVTYVDETHTIKGRDGYVVDTWLVTYENNRAIERNKVSTDTYPAKADTVYYGTEMRIGGY